MKKARNIASLLINQPFKHKPTFSQPLEICSFGLLEDGTKVPGVLKRLTIPELPCDCHVGFEPNVLKDPTKTSSLQPVIDCLKDNNINIKGSIVTFRNNLNKILSTPYSRDEWVVNVKREHGTVFLDIVHLDQSPPNDQQAKSMYWGQKFEQNCTDSTGASPEYCSVIRTKLNQNLLIVGAEIDCYDTEDTYLEEQKAKRGRSSPTNTSSTPSSSSSTPTTSTTSSSAPASDTNTSTAGAKRSRDDVETAAKTESKQHAYVEIKTHRAILNDRMEWSFKRYKLMHCWIQSFLAGVPTILFGFRDDNGVIKELKRYKTLDIPKHAGNAWDPYVCLNFADAVMTMLWQKTEDGKKYSLIRNNSASHVYLDETSD